MKRKLLLFTTLLLVLIYACKKDKFQDESLSADNSTITIGNYSGMSLTTYDTTLAGQDNGPVATYEVDLNKDLIPDIRFSNSVWTSAGTGLHTSCYITSLYPAVELYGFTRDDTTFNYATKDTFYLKNNRVEIYIYNYYSCSKIHPTDKIYHITPNTFVAPALMKGSILRSDGLFKTAEFRLFNQGGGFPSTSTIHGDTVIYESHPPSPYCGNFPENKISYIGVKMRINNMEKIGWLKIIIGAWGQNITIMESTMQE